MDTKWKNIKYGRITKTAALLLAAIMFFAAGCFADLFIKGFANFNSFSHPETWTQTASFRWQMNRYMYDVLEIGKNSTYDSFESYRQNDDFAKTLESDYKLMKEKAAASVDMLDKSGISVFVDPQNRYRYALEHKGVTYLMSHNGELIDYDAFQQYDYVNSFTAETTAAVEESVTQVTVQLDNGQTVTSPHRSEPLDKVYSAVKYYDPYAGGGYPNYVAEVSEALCYLDSIDDYTCYGENSKEYILEMIEKRCVEALQSSYHHAVGYGSSSRRISDTKSVYYAVKYKNSDKVFTNCGVTASDTHEQILEKMRNKGNLEWAECRTNGKYELLTGGEAVKTVGIYSTLHEWLFGLAESVLKPSYTAENYEFTDAYFAIDEVPDGADSFTVTKASFRSYNDSVPLTGYLVAAVISLFIACAICIYLLSAAGKTPDGEVKLRFFDKVPAEISLILSLATMAALAAGVVVIVVCEFDPMMASGAAYPLMVSLAKFTSSLVGLAVAAFFLIWTGLNASFLRNVRNKTFARHSIIGWALKPVGIIFRKLRSGAKKTADKLRYAIDCDYSKGQGTKFKVLSCLAVSLFTVATIVYYFVAGVLTSYEEILALIMIFLGIIGDIAAVLFIILLVVSQDRIMEGVSDIKKGNLGRKIDVKHMPPFMCRFAQDILSIRDGMQNAVESAVKDQRMKAELITNVSHDLKTPLTSIVNYVDLLKKCEIEDETAQKYVSILDEKSHRMKKLIEDLVEASKASSGALEIHPVKLNLCELAAQAVGEHEDEMKNYGIELVLRLPDEPVTVFADAQKVSRITENLFSNVRKYTLEGTRVYIEVTRGNEFGSVTFKNVSKNALDVSPDELTQRFVRGDASRSGEGSGLGLSIAKDLCELQKGKLGIHTDGDLFKATVALPLA